MDRELKEGSPLLSDSKDPEKQYGVTEQGDTSQQSGVSSSSKKTSSKHSTTSCGCCCYFSLSLLLTFLLISTLLAGFGALSYIPYPTQTTTQGVLQGNTVPIYFSSKTDIPRGPNTYWYESVSVRLNSDEEIVNTNVDFVFVKGSDACAALHDKTDMFESENITLSSGEVLKIRDAGYLTADTLLDLTFNVFDTPSTKVELFVIENQADYDCFKDRKGDCKFLRIIPLKSGLNSLEYYTPVSSYYYFVLRTEEEITFNYDYTTQFSFYNITDYDKDDAFGSCNIEPSEERTTTCDFVLSNRRGCLFVSSPILDDGAEPSFVELSVHVVHEQFTIPSVACLTFAGAFFLLFLSGLIAYGWISARRSVRKKS